MKANASYSRDEVIREAYRLSEKYQNRKWFRFFNRKVLPGYSANYPTGGGSKK